MTKLIAALGRDRRGATAIEYGLIAALVCVAALTGLKNFANASINMWNSVSNTVQKNG
jgi:pilus assembly protein Flp/PilA